MSASVVALLFALGLSAMSTVAPDSACPFARSVTVPLKVKVRDSGEGVVGDLSPAHAAAARASAQYAKVGFGGYTLAITIG